MVKEKHLNKKHMIFLSESVQLSMKLPWYTEDSCLKKYESAIFMPVPLLHFSLFSLSLFQLYYLLQGSL